MGDFDEGTTDVEDFDFDTPIVDDSPAVTQDAPTQDAPSINPAWNELLDILPQEFKGLATPHLQKWDSGVQDLVKKAREEAALPYQPFQQFIDQKIDPQELLGAKQIWDRLNTDPLALYNQLTPVLQEMGLLEAAKQQVEEQQAAEEEEGLRDPRVDALVKQQEALIQSLQQSQQQAAVEAYSKQMDEKIASEFDELETKLGRKMPAWLVSEVAARAGMMMDRDQRPYVSIAEAYQEVQQLRTQLISGRPGQQAPRVVPSGGGYPAPQANPDALKTEQGRADAMKEIIDRYK